MTESPSLPRSRPEDGGIVVGARLEPIGCARRYQCTAAGGTRLWRFDAADATAAAVARRLHRLGGVGIGGFVAAGEDEDGIWLLRGAGEPTLAAILSENRLPMNWRRATEIALCLTRIAARCEAEALFPGPLMPKSVSVREDGDGPVVGEFRADALVRAVVGAGTASPVGSAATSARWMAPEQAAGKAWNNAANRYMLGLVFYRLLAGEHPFSGKGLRLGLDEQAQRGAPPLPDEVATALPPGLHSFCLRLLDPDEDSRPRSAKAIAARLDGFLTGTATPVVERAASERIPCIAETSESAAPETRHPEAVAPSRLGRRVRTGLFWALPILSVSAAIIAVRTVDFQSAASAHVPERPPLSSAATTSDDCAGCHPRQVAEWKRSVMAHSARSPLFQALEILIQEQVARSRDCPGGAGVLRSADPRTACRLGFSGPEITGFGGPLWCVNCHTPGENLQASLPPWDGTARVSSSRAPLIDLLPAATMEGISCAFCHQVTGPVRPGNLAASRYEGNPFWTSLATGQRLFMRPEDERGLFGIGNSGYLLDSSSFLAGTPGQGSTVAGGAHLRPTAATRKYLRSSEFCGACHDVRLFGTDVLGAARGEHFKRLRNAYSEWVAWADTRRRIGAEVASCMDCHMSEFPGICVPGTPAPGAAAARKRRHISERACPPGTRFEKRAPGRYSTAAVAVGSPPQKITSHYFSGVDTPLTTAFAPAHIDDATIDINGIPVGALQRRDLLLGSALDFAIPSARIAGDTLEIAIDIENTGAGHRVPAGFSQEREFWVHLKVTDARGAIVYEVGRVDRNDEDLHDKIFVRVNTDARRLDRRGQPIGLFGAEVIDGPDVPQWDPDPARGGTAFRGRGLINFQNGFLRCVRCIGTIDSDGRCQPGPGQDGHRAARFADGAYDLDTGACISNLVGENALFEVYFPVGSLDASRGLIKGPDAIVDTRSLPPDTPVRYVYELPLGGTSGPLAVEARLLFRAFPPFLLKAFAAYEAQQEASGLRPSGALITREALSRLQVVELAAVKTEAR